MHADDFTGVVDGKIQAVAALGGQFSGDTVLLTDQNHRDVPLASRHDGTGHFRAGSVIAPHDVDSNNNAPAQPVDPYFSAALISLPL